MSQGGPAGPETATVTVLVVEDEPMLNDAISLRLRAEGYEVLQAFDGPAAVDTFTAHGCDLVVLDIMLPGFDGLEVCRRIQAKRPVPVLMVTARDEDTDVLVGLGVGADDYLTKPFSLRIMTARVKALLRRVERAAELAAATASNPSALVFGDLVIEPASRRVRLRGKEPHLTPTEFDLLLELASHSASVRTRDQLMSSVWGWSDATGTRTLDSHVKTLRAKVGAELIRTVHGVGYAFEPPTNSETR